MVSAFYLAELDQFGSYGILNVTTTLILYTNHAKLMVCCAHKKVLEEIQEIQAVTLLCPQEVKKLQYIEFHVSFTLFK